MRVVFLDRDGTMGGTGGGIDPKLFRLYDETMSAISLLKKQGFEIIMITNQSRISRGYFTEEAFNIETRKMLSNLKNGQCEIKDYFYCPHYNEECECQKPDIGMIKKACLRYPFIDLSHSYFIGDNGSTDMVCADNAKLNKILVRTGWGESSLTTHRYLWNDIEPDAVVSNIYEAAKWICNNE